MADETRTEGGTSRRAFLEGAGSAGAALAAAVGPRSSEISASATRAPSSR